MYFWAVFSGGTVCRCFTIASVRDRGPDFKQLRWLTGLRLLRDSWCSLQCRHGCGLLGLMVARDCPAWQWSVEREVGFGPSCSDKVPTVAGVVGGKMCFRIFEAPKLWWFDEPTLNRRVHLLSALRKDDLPALPLQPQPLSPHSTCVLHQLDLAPCFSSALRATWSEALLRAVSHRRACC